MGHFLYSLTVFLSVFIVSLWLQSYIKSIFHIDLSIFGIVSVILLPYDLVCFSFSFLRQSEGLKLFWSFIFLLYFICSSWVFLSCPSFEQSELLSQFSVSVFCISFYIIFGICPAFLYWLGPRGCLVCLLDKWEKLVIKVGLKVGHWLIFHRQLIDWSFNLFTLKLSLKAMCLHLNLFFVCLPVSVTITVFSLWLNWWN